MSKTVLRCIIRLPTFTDRRGTIIDKRKTHTVRIDDFQIRTISLKELVSGSELIQFLRIEIPYGKTYGRIPFARVLYAFNGVEQEDAFPMDLDKGVFIDSSFENVFKDEKRQATFQKVAPEIFRKAVPQIIEAVRNASPKIELI